MTWPCWASPPHLMLDCTSYTRTHRPGVMTPILQVKELRLCKAKYFAPKQGKELRHPNHVFLTQGLCAHPCFYFVQLLVVVLESCPFSGRSVHAEGQQPPGQPIPGFSGGLTPGGGPKGTCHPRSWLFLCLAFGPTGPVFISLPWSHHFSLGFLFPKTTLMEK